MSSNIRIKSKCDYCGDEFIAKTTKTRYCSHNCNRKAYKAKQRIEKINKASQVIETKKESSDIEIVQLKDFLTVKDASLLLGCSTKTVYRLINDGTIKAVNLSSRLTRISKKSLKEIFLLKDF